MHRCLPDRKVRTLAPLDALTLGDAEVPEIQRFHLFDPAVDRALKCGVRGDVCCRRRLTLDKRTREFQVRPTGKLNSRRAQSIQMPFEKVSGKRHVQAV